ncbi:MAG: hypothetical protein ACI9MC_003292 [Kiritimatiellia bacterium]|jgi:hypothetical protein
MCTAQTGSPVAEPRPISTYLAVAGLIFDVLVPPVGLLLSIIAVRIHSRPFTVGATAFGLFTTTLSAGALLLFAWTAFLTSQGADMLDRFDQVSQHVSTHQELHGELPRDLADLGLPTKLQRDPWGMTFVFKRDAESWTLVSAGPDRRPGTSDDLELHPRMDGDARGKAISAMWRAHYDAKLGR